MTEFKEDGRSVQNLSATFFIARITLAYVYMQIKGVGYALEKPKKFTLFWSVPLKSGS